MAVRYRGPSVGQRVDAHAGEWEKSQDLGALVPEDDSEDGEGGPAPSLPLPSGKIPVKTAPAKNPPMERHIS